MGFTDTMINLFLKPNPFTNETITYKFDKSDSLNNIIINTLSQAETLPNLPKADLLYEMANYVEVDNILIPKEKWKNYIVEDNSRINMVFLPLGSGGEGDKSTVATVLGAVVAVIASVASFGVAGAAAGVLGTVGANMAGAAVGAAVSIAGGLTINALFPAQAAADTQNEIKVDKDTYTLTGGRNQINPYGAIPVILGKIKVTPYYYRPTFFEAQGSLQYLSSGFVWGYADNGLKIESVKIGDTPITQFTPVKYENRVGTQPSPNDDIYKIQSEVNLELINLDSTEPKGDYLYRTVKNTNNIVVDVSFPQGLYMINQNGEKGTGYCKLSICARKVGTTEWTEYNTDGNVAYEVLNNFPPDFTSGYYLDKGDKTIYIYLTPYTYDEQGNVRYYYFLQNFDTMPNQYINIVLYKLVIKNGNYTIEDLREDKTQMNIVKTEILPNHMEQGRYIAIYIGGKYYLKRKIKIIENNKTNLISYTFNYPVAKGDYELRVGKIPLESEPQISNLNKTLINRVVWTSYGATYKEASFKFKYPLATTYLYLQANEKLNGVVDALTGICTSILYDYNYINKRWEIKATNNPASIILYVLTGNPNAKRLKFNSSNNINNNWDSIDKASFERFHDYCRLNNYQYNRYITEAVGVWELVQEIASTARAFVSLESGKWSIIIDEKQDIVKYMITPFNSWGASTIRNLPDIPHALRVSFYNEKNDYVADERIVYADGFNEDNAEDFQAQAVQGITNPDKIYIFAREMLKAAQSRLETHTVYMDIESIVFNLRDRVFFSYDYLQNAIGYGRIEEFIIKFVGGNLMLVGIRSNQYYTTDINKTYGVVIRTNNNNNSLVTIPIQNLDNSNIIMFVKPTDYNNKKINYDNLYAIGELNNTGSDCIISKIERENDFIAKITLIDYAPAIYDEASKPVPPFDSNINTVRPSIQRPTAPFGSTVNISYIDGRNGTEYFIEYVWNAPLNSPVNIKEYEVQYKFKHLDWDNAGTTTYLFLQMQGAPDSYEAFRVRAVAVNNTVSDWHELRDFKLDSVQLEPDDIKLPINIFVRDNITYIDWQAIFDLRNIEYEVRYGNSWKESQIYKTVSDTEVKITQTGKYFIKAKVQNQNIYSKNAASVTVLEIANAGGEDVIYELISSPDWIGEKLQFELKNGELQTRAAQAIYTIPVNKMLVFNQNTQVYLTYNYDIKAYKDNDFFALPDVFASPDVFGTQYEQDFFALPDVFAERDIFNPRVTGVAYNSQPQIKIFNGKDWTDWQNFTPNFFTGQKFYFRIVCTKEDSNSLLRLLKFNIQGTINKRIEIFNDIKVNADNGAIIKFNKPFNIAPSYQIFIINQEQGDNLEIINLTNELINIKIKNNNIYVERFVNILLQGY